MATPTISFGVRARKLVRDDNGNALIEFAVLSPIYVALLLASVQTGLVYFDAQAIQTAADKLARLNITGQSTTAINAGVAGGQTSAQAISSYYSSKLATYLHSPIDPTQVKVSFQVASNFSLVNTTSSNATYNTDGTLNTTGYTNGSTASACQYAVLKLYYQVPTFTFVDKGIEWFDLSDATDANGQHIVGGTRQIVGTAVFKTEAFGGAQC